MKIRFTLLFLLAAFSATAQGKGQLDSLKYILPEFQDGTVIFSDKTMKRGTLNISPLDQSVYCITGDRDTLYVGTYPDIISVSVPGRSFVGWNDSFVEIICSNSDTGIGIIRSTMRVNNVKKGAYGMNSSTSSTKSYSVDAASGTLGRIIIEDPRNYSHVRKACLLNNGRILSVAKKSFQKMFPAQKDYIETVWKDLDINPTDVESVIAFYNELLHK